MSATEKKPKIDQAKLIQGLQESQKATDDKLSVLIDTVGALSNTIAGIAAVPAGTNAKDAPAVISKHFEAAEQFVGGAGSATLIEHAGKQEIEQDVIGDVNSPTFKEKMANLAFNEEMLTIYIPTTDNTDSAPRFSITVNGEERVFERNKSYTVPRKFVEGLARCKPVGYANEQYRDAQGLEQYRYPAARGLRYPFTLVNGTSRDNAWLQHIIAQP